jgi:hypothetical protein
MYRRGPALRESRSARSNAQEPISCSAATVEAVALKWNGAARRVNYRRMRMGTDAVLTWLANRDDALCAHDLR